jgi:hypothetical protein
MQARGARHRHGPAPQTKPDQARHAPDAGVSACPQGSAIRAANTECVLTAEPMLRLSQWLLALRYSQSGTRIGTFGLARHASARPASMSAGELSRAILSLPSLFPLQTVLPTVTADGPHPRRAPTWSPRAPQSKRPRSGRPDRGPRRARWPAQDSCGRSEDCECIQGLPMMRDSPYRHEERRGS